MRKVNLLILLVAAFFFALTSCQKEATEELNTTTKESAKYGADAPTAEITAYTGTIESFPKTPPSEKLIIEPEVTQDRKSSQSRNGTLELTIASGISIPDLHCNETVHGTTRGKHNSFSNYTYGHLGFSSNLNGGDQLYRFHLASADQVTFNLDQTSQNMAMFLYKGDYDVHGRIIKIHSVKAWTTSHSRYSDHIGPVHLSAGNYILVVDGAPGYPSDYRLRVNCAYTVDTCDDMESYYLGNISPQSPKWEKWKSSAADGQVKKVGGNKYIKLERMSWGAQPDLIYRTGKKSSGKHRLEMDLWIYNSRSAHINIQKQLRSEWGGQIYFYGDGSGEVKINGYTHAFHYPQNRWAKVRIDFDFPNNRTKLYIDGHHKATWSIRAYSNGAHGSYQIEGVDFYPYASNSQFYVDNVCFDRY